MTAAVILQSLALLGVVLTNLWLHWTTRARLDDVEAQLRALQAHRRDGPTT